MTRSQRHTYYIIMLRECEMLGFDKIFGLCNLARKAAGEGVNIHKWERFEKLLPELFAKKPFGVKENEYWFSTDHEGWNKRRELLKQCIKETA